MDEARWERIAISTGFVAVVFFVVGFVLPGAPLMANASITKVHSYYIDRKTSVLVGFLVLWVGIAFFLWFIGALRSFLRRHEGGDGRLSATAFGAGIAAMAVVLVTTAIPASLAYNVAATGPTEAMKALFDLGTLSAVLTGPPAAVLIGATSLIVLRHGALPVWTAWFGIVVALLNIAGTAAIFRTTGFLSPTGPLGFVAFGTVMLWIIAVAATMLPRIGSGAARAA